jgi:hypothetical protein
LSPNAKTTQNTKSLTTWEQIRGPSIFWPCFRGPRITPSSDQLISTQTNTHPPTHSFIHPFIQKKEGWIPATLSMYYLHEKKIPNFVFVTARCPDPTINPMYLASRLGIQTCGACGFLFVSPACCPKVGDSDLKGSHHQLVIIGHYGLLGPRLDTHFFEVFKVNT